VSLSFILGLLALSIGFVLAFFFAGFETGAYSLSPLRFRLRQADSQPQALRLADQLEDMPSLIATALVGTNFGHYLVAASATSLLLPIWGENEAELLSTLLLTPLVFVFTEVLPKELFRRHADNIVYASAGVFVFSALLFRPATRLLRLVIYALEFFGLAPEGGHDAGVSAQERFTIALTEGGEEGTLTPSQATMAHRIMSLAGRTVSDVMIPMAQVVKLDLRTGIEEARDTMLKTGMSRIPVYEGRRDNLLGTVWLYDLCLSEPSDLHELVRAAPRLGRELTVDMALLCLRAEQERLAFVQDRHGSLVGIVTLRDLASEIVGDLHDL